MREVALAEQLANDHSGPVARPQRVRGDLSDVARRNHGHRQIWLERSAIDSLVLDQTQSRVEVFEEHCRPKDEHIHALESPEAFLLRVEPGDWTRAVWQIAADAAQEDDRADGGVTDCARDRLALPILLRAVVRRLQIGGQQRIHRVRATECRGQERGIGRVAGQHLRAAARKPGQFAGGAPERTDPFALHEQLLADPPAGVAAGAHHGDHRRPLFPRAVHTEAGPLD